MSDIKFNGVIYASSDSANITYKDTSVYNKLEELSANGVINGLVVNVTAANWVLQADGTYKKIISVEQITGKETLDICLYPGDSYTDEQVVAFSELITSIETAEGRIVLTATEEITVSFRIFLYGKISFDKSNLVALSDSVMEVIEITREDFNKLSKEQKASGVYHVTDDTEELSAKNLEYDGSVTGLGTNVQDAVDNLDSKLNKNMGGLRFGVDGDGNYGYYKADGSLVPFKSGLEGTLLWSRSASNFSAQTVSIDLSEYAFIAIVVRASTIHGNGTSLPQILKIGESGRLSATADSTTSFYRDVSCNANGVTFKGGYWETSANNKYCIPIEIYGYK